MLRSYHRYTSLLAPNAQGKRRLQLFPLSVIFLLAILLVFSLFTHRSSPINYAFRLTYADEPSPDRSSAITNRYRSHGMAIPDIVMNTEEINSKATPQHPVTGINRGQPRGKSRIPVLPLPFTQPEQINDYTEARLRECKVHNTVHHGTEQTGHAQGMVEGEEQVESTDNGAEILHPEEHGYWKRNFTVDEERSPINLELEPEPDFDDPSHTPNFTQETSLEDGAEDDSRTPFNFKAFNLEMQEEDDEFIDEQEQGDSTEGQEDFTEAQKQDDAAEKSHSSEPSPENAIENGRPLEDNDAEQNTHEFSLEEMKEMDESDMAGSEADTVDGSIDEEFGEESPLEAVPTEDFLLDDASCPENTRKIVILQSAWFVESVRGAHTGEAIWAKSIMQTLHSQGYSMLLSSLGWGNDDFALTLQFNQKYRSMVKFILADPTAIDRCHEQEGCIRSTAEPNGIDKWKLLSFHWWDHVANPLGKDWTISPHLTNNHRFIPYSIEPSCMEQALDFEARAANRAFIMGKHDDYLDPKNNDTLFDLPEILSATHGDSSNVIVAMGSKDPEITAQLDASHIHNVGSVGPNEFRSTLAESRVFVGIGRPRISPSPFDALCLGVPFINPIGIWDADDIWDTKEWLAQQWAMHILEPPYVYHVFAHDTAGLNTAIDMAIANPIDSFIPEYMTFDFACEAITALIDEDWYAKYRSLLSDVVPDEDMSTKW